MLDFPSRPRYSPRVKEARLLDDGPLRVGSRIALQVGKDRFTPAVIELTSPERLVLLVKGPGFWGRHTYNVRSASGGDDGVPSRRVRRAAGQALRPVHEQKSAARSYGRALGHPRGCGGAAPGTLALQRAVSSRPRWMRTRVSWVHSPTPLRVDTLHSPGTAL
ncbi:MAG: hypothetical protein EXR49_01610 [Dehalococcoidia bacterium]|nr:hypothetical protein [Dehalococcoidia bacterium]